MHRSSHIGVRALLPVLAALFLSLALPKTGEAQISFGVNIGSAPVCPYGYYDYAPYNCSPYGYYGPEWFNNGSFLGAGPWFGGPRGFRGYVNRRYDPRFGYHGGFPGRGAVGYYHGGPIHGFHGNQYRYGHGGYGGYHGGGYHGGHGYHGGGFHGGHGGGFHGGGHHGGGHHHH